MMSPFCLWRFYYKYFKKMTSHGINPTVVMGRNTWESLPKKPLENRKNIIISKTLKQENVSEHENTFVVDSISRIQRMTEKKDPIWILGGGKIYYQMIHSKEVNEIYLCWRVSPLRREPGGTQI